MAKYRKVDPRIWNDAKFTDLTDEGKLAFLFVMTHPHMTSVGAMRATLSGLAEELGWEPEAFREAFREALSKGMVKHNRKACFIGLPKFIKYNSPESPNVMRAWGKAWDLVPECGEKNALYHELKGFAKGLGESYLEAFAEAFPKACLHPLPNQEPEQEQDSNSESKDSDSELSLNEKLWGEGLQTVMRLSGLERPKAASMLGKWRKDHGDQQTLDAIVRAERDAVSEPVSWITAALKSKGGNTDREAEHWLRGAV